MNIFICNVFCIEIPVSKSVNPDQMPHFVASELGLHCLHMSPNKLAVPKGLVLKFL